MSRTSCQKICFWRIMIESGRKRPGSLLLISAYLMMILTVLGLGLMTISRLYIRVSAYKKNAAIMGYAAENGLKQGLEDFALVMESSPSPVFLAESDTGTLLHDARRGGARVISRCLAAEFPLDTTGSSGSMSWNSRMRFLPLRIEEMDTFFKARYRGEIVSEGRLARFAPRRRSQLSLVMEMFAGNLPLPLLPLLVAEDISPEGRSEFLKKNDIRIESVGHNPVAPDAFFTGENLIPQDAHTQIQKALNIDIFHPEDLSNATLRKALGLEISPEPVPDGVYLVHDDLGLGGIFVQGDLDEIILAIDHGYQIIAFRQGPDLWDLRFRPDVFHTVFTSPAETETYDLIPQAMIIVEGEIRSLGGGYVDASGDVVMARDEEIPCLLHGVNLTIVSSHRITISSHLIHEGVTWRDGVPFLKNADSQLHILASGENMFGEKTGGEIVIGEDSPQDIKIQASLTSAQADFVIQGENKEVSLYGSLHAPGYAGNGNDLRLLPDKRHLFDVSLLSDAPRTALPLLMAANCTIIEWAENLTHEEKSP